MTDTKDADFASYPLLNSDLYEDSIEAPKQEIELAQEKLNLDKIARKLSWRILPFLCLIVCLAHVDRLNLSFVALSMFESVGLTCQNYGLTSAILMLGYAVFQIPSSYGIVRVGAPVWLGMQLLGWGAVSVGFAFISTSLGFILIRLLLGILEAGYLTGVWYYVTLILPHTHLTVPFAIIDLGEGFSQVVAPGLTVGLLSLDGKADLMGWQWVFIIEGAFTFLAGLAVISMLPKNLDKTNAISEEERTFLQHKIRTLEKTKSKQALGGIAQSSYASFVSALGNWRIWHLTAIRFIKNMSAEGTMYWLPIIIYTMLQKENIQSCGRSREFLPILLTIIPYVCAAVATLINGHHSQKWQENRYHGGIPYIVAGICFILFPFIRKWSQIAGFIALVVTVSGEKMSNPNLTNLVCGHSTQQDVHVTLAMNNAIGILGGFVGPYAFGLLYNWTGKIEIAVLFLGVTLAIAGVLFLIIDEPVQKKHRPYTPSKLAPKQDST